MNPPLSADGITGSSLLRGELCLTFDDGPGPRTMELAAYLSDRGVPATFFVVGKHVAQHPEVVPRLRQLGHEVGNHTYHHPNLQDLCAVGGEIVAELTSAATTISTTDPAVVAFRPPYGAWSPKVAAVLDRHVFTAAQHVGPILWDVDGRDWSAWDRGVEAADCAEEYLQAIGEAGRGVVLLHDSTADSEVLKERNRTPEMIRLLVPRLVEMGYRFVSLGDVPEIAAARARGVTFRVTAPGSTGLEAKMVSHHEALLSGDDGRILVAEDGDGGIAPLTPDRDDPASRFEVVPLSGDRAAFRSRTGHFLTGLTADGAFGVTASGLGPETSFVCRAVGPR